MKRTPSRRRAFAVIVAAALAGSAAAPAIAADEEVVAALHASLARRAGHLQRLLDEKDFRSLAQAAAGTELLAGVLRARGDDAAWQAAAGSIVAAAKTIQEAARSGSEQDTGAAIKEFEAACTAAKNHAPAGKPLSPPQPVLRPLMAVIDGVYADAKIAVMTGRPADAKQGGYVLAELGRLASNLRGNNRTPQQWTQLSGLLTDAALEAARSPSDDAFDVRVLLRGIAVRCDACHNARQ